MPETRSKRVASVTTIDPRPRKRVNRATSNGSSRTGVDAEPDGHVGAASNGASQSSETNSTREGEDDLEELRRQLAKDQNNWRSPIYTFFHPDIGRHDGRVCQIFTCAADVCKGKAQDVLRFQDSKDLSSTANLNRHARRCFGDEVIDAALKKGLITPLSSPPAAFGRRGQPGQRPVQISDRVRTDLDLRAHIATWVAESNHPAEMVREPRFRYTCTIAWPNLAIPSPNTVRRDIRVIYSKFRERIGTLLQDYPGRIHLGTDAWTSTNHRAMVAWTVHLEHEGRMTAFLLDIVELAESHTGQALANATQKMLQGHGLEMKILAIVSDNATSNDTQRENLAAMENSFKVTNHVRCFNHTLQLSAKALMLSFNPPSGKALDTDFDDDQGDLLDVEDDADEGSNDDGKKDNHDFNFDLRAYDDVNVEELIDLDPESRETLMEHTKVVRDTISKLHRLSCFLVRSTTVALPQWFRYCKNYELKPRIFPRDVVTRWNSTYDMLSFALEYRHAIDAMTLDKGFKLREYELRDEEEWVIVGDLVQLLSKYKEATLHFSKNSASVSAVIHAMDMLNVTLNTSTRKPYHPAISRAIALACDKMNRYYSLTDDSHVYRIAMVMHPGMKLQYFRNEKWEKEWIDVAEELVRNEYRDNYEKETSSVEPIQPTKRVSFGILSVAAPAHGNELDAYLSLPPEMIDEEEDPGAALKWWKMKRHIYPNLHRMALDYLSIPATSTAVERVFSQGRHLLPFTRNALRPPSIQAFLCVGSWLRCGIFKFDDVVAALSGTETFSMVSPRETPSPVASVEL